MNLGKTLFAQLMEFVSWTSFARIVVRYGGDTRVRSLNCTEQQFSLDLAVWQPGGRLVFETSHLAINRTAQADGQATLRWLDAASGRVRPQLGSYRAELEGVENGLKFKLSTESGPLSLQGLGNWDRQCGVVFNGTARASAASRSDFEGLLSLIGPAQPNGDRAIHIAR